MTWLSFILIPWLGTAVMFSLLVFPLLPFALGTTAFYILLSTREGRALRRAVGAGLLLAALVSIEWAAVQTADREAGEILAASRPSATVMYRVSVSPIPWAIAGVGMFFVGMKVSSKERHLAWTVSETASFGLVCPAVAFLVRQNVFPLGT